MGKLIDADALIQSLMIDPVECPGCPEPEFLSDLIEVLKTAPPVDAVPVVHGHWIDIDTETYTWKIRCSRCGHERSMMSTGKTYPMWCENCGTRMDGDDNGKT